MSNSFWHPAPTHEIMILDYRNSYRVILVNRLLASRLPFSPFLPSHGHRLAHIHIAKATQHINDGASVKKFDLLADVEVWLGKQISRNTEIITLIGQHHS